MAQFCKHGLPLGMCRLGEKDCKQSTWQGLTDDEIIDLIIGKGWIDRLNDTYDLDHAKQEAIAMFGAIEQALKEKNT